MASANIFDLYSTQEEEEVPLVRKKKLTRKHDGEPSQMPSAKKNRATDPSNDGPSGQTFAQPPAPLEKEIPPPPAPAATNPSPPAPTKQTQQVEGVPPGAKLSGRSLRSAKDRLAHILKHDRYKEVMAEAETMGVNQILNKALYEVASAMLTMTVARARAARVATQGARNNNVGQRSVVRADSRGPDRSRSNTTIQRDDGVRSGIASTQRENSRTPSKSHRSETSRSGSRRLGSKKTPPRHNQTGASRDKKTSQFKDGYGRDEANSHHTDRSKEKESNGQQGRNGCPGHAEKPPLHHGQKCSWRE
ncbi:uncharacterized protein LOC133815105 [Humulus lupulus]|uniref:uncharacterized protein LOC133815105 n=1 Tax=Humulus lupulus TaxID=3486 RepID=UPI002B404158|nr:uncharacterized protein LOC133815105 [Humulus lupulus]